MTTKKSTRSEKLVVNFTLDVDKFFKMFPFIDKACLEHVERKVTYLDEHKTKAHAHLSYSQSGQNCYWDRHPFTGPGIGCPLRRNYEPQLKVYQSAINNNTYAIQDTLVSRDGHWLMEGYFCSPECCLAYIEDQGSKPLYIDSRAFLMQIAGRVVQPAASWRLLIPYGGTQTIEEFRSACGNKAYREEGLITKPIYFVFKETYRI